MAELSSQTLHIVARELNSELNDARTALEAFGEQQDNIALLRKCNEHLRSVHGALRISEVYGAALLAEEMGQVARYLIDNFAERRHLAEGLDALMRAMVQLPTYLERVMSGGRDMALVLLPLLNDLRAVRGHALLSEGTLLLLNLSSDQQANPVAAPGEALTIAQWARKLRTRFQLGLLGWIKGERVEQNLEILSRSAEKLEQVATTQPVFQLWWVVGAVLEALREGGLEGSASIKRLLGHADREMKRLYEQGEGRYVDTPPLELLNNLLYYVARARSSGPRVAAVRASFRLTELLPVDDRIEQARESLSAPSVKLMKTVAAAIKEDLGRVKDALDIFVRQGGTQVDELAPQLELLKKIADTLGVLGLGDLRDKVQGETGDLQGIVNARSAASESTLLRMAATLIKVEDSLDEQLVGMIVPSADGATAPLRPAGPEDIEFRQVTEAVLRECIVNMARIKEAVALSFEKPREAQVADQIPQLMRGMIAGLLMLGKTRVVEIMEGIDRALGQLLRSDGMTLPQEAVDRLADAIVAVEYYMETLQAGRTDPWYMLDNAENCLRFLADAQPIPRVDALAQGGDHARTVVIEPMSQTVASPTLAPTEHEPTAVLDPATVVRQKARACQARGQGGAGGEAGRARDRSGIPRAVHRRSEGRDHQAQAPVPAVGREPAGPGLARQRAPLVPHAEGQRPHGRRAAHRRVRVGRREPAQPRHQQDAGAQPRNDDAAAPSGRGGAGAGRAAGNCAQPASGHRRHHRRTQRNCRRAAQRAASGCRECAGAASCCSACRAGAANAVTHADHHGPAFASQSAKKNGAAPGHKTAAAAPDGSRPARDLRQRNRGPSRDHP